MRSLVVTLNTPEARNGGAAIRNAQTIRALSRLGPVDVVALGVDAADAAAVTVGSADTVLCPSPPAGQSRRRWQQALRARRWVIRPRGHWRTESYRSPSGLRALRQHVARQRPDLVIASQWPTGEYALEACQHSRLVFDTHNVESDLRSSIDDQSSARSDLGTRLAHARLRKWESHLGRAADEIWVCSDQDAALWHRAYGSSTPVRVVPNTVPTSPTPPSLERVSHHIVLTGTFSYPPNVGAARELVDEILPAIRKQVPAANVTLVGREPVPEVLALNNPDRGVRVTGPVPDVEPFLARAGLMLVPLRSGGGTRLKILEAMALGLPVVSTPKGAEGIACQDGVDILLGSTREDLANAAISLMCSPELAARIGAAGRTLVETRYSQAALEQLVRQSAITLDLVA